MENNIDTMVQGAGSEAHEQQPAERTFTQDEVNRIVQERLTRDRAKRDKDNGIEDMLNDTNDREVSLSARESKVKCHELILEKGYSKDLLEILDTSNFEKFQEQAENIEKMIKSETVRYPGTVPNPRRSDRQTSGFTKSAHVPKQYGV